MDYNINLDLIDFEELDYYDKNGNIRQLEFLVDKNASDVFQLYASDWPQTFHAIKFVYNPREGKYIKYNEKRLTATFIDFINTMLPAQMDYTYVEPEQPDYICVGLYGASPVRITGSWRNLRYSFEIMENCFES